MLDTTRARGKEFVKLFNEDVVSKYMKLPVFPNVPQTIYSLESLLNSENYKSANDEYQRLKRERKRNPHWYNLFDGPGSLETLSKHLKRGAQYNLLYRDWSSTTHASDVSRFLTQTKKGFPAFQPLRNHEQLKELSGMASTFILHVTMAMIKKIQIR